MNTVETSARILPQRNTVGMKGVDIDVDHLQGITSMRNNQCCLNGCLNCPHKDKEELPYENITTLTYFVTSVLSDQSQMESLSQLLLEECDQEWAEELVHIVELMRNKTTEEYIKLLEVSPWSENQIARIVKKKLSRS